MFNTEWLYSPNDYEKAYKVEFSEADFEMVSVPHANKILEKYKGDDFQKQIDSYRFVSWYRKHFTLDRAYADKKISVEFEGVATVAEVYVNGKKVGTHKGAYTGFTYDITDLVNIDGRDNVIAVRVDSEKHKDIPPEGENVDYCLFGGIVRNVHLHIKEKTNISDVIITTPYIKDGDSTTKFDVEIESDREKEIFVKVSVREKSGAEVSSVCQKVMLEGGKNKVTLETENKEIELWSIETPNLYTAEVSLMENTLETYTDSITETFGYRWFEFTDEDKESAFYLNGKKLVIRGINRHEQWPWIGRAIVDKLQIADADLIKNTGINAVRCSHYPQTKSFLNRCDEIGLLVFEEAPGWQHIGDESWKKIYKENLVEMVTRDKNHPSIISWGVRVNESQDDHKLYEITNKLVKELDPTRPTHASRRREDYEVCECQENIYGVNYTYPDKVHTTPFVITEYAMDWFDGNGFPGAVSEKAKKFIDSFAKHLDYTYGNDYCSGGFGWSMFDYNNEVNYTNTGNVFYSGIYDIFRYEKPVSYLYRSQKDTSEEVVLYIVNYWADASEKEVMVLSNCEEIELFVNGKSQGRKKPDAYMNLPHPAYVFKDIVFEEGKLEAKGYIDGKEVKTFTRHTPKEAKEMSVTPEYKTLLADGADITSVVIELKDENGTILPYDKSEVSVEIEGPGKFIGQEKISLEGGHTAFMVQSLYKKMGKVNCRVKTADGNICGECEIEIVEKQM